MKIIETDLAREVITWLIDQQWEVYQEVMPVPGGPVADIVAVQGRLVWIIECKNTFGLSVIEQAYNWRGRVHFVSVAVPVSNRNTHREHGMAGRIVRTFGIGHISVRSPGKYAEVRQEIEPRFNRTVKVSSLLKILTPEHKTFAEAGNNRGERWSPFQQTCTYLRRVVEQQPGLTMRDAVGSIKTHYSSPATARACLLRWVEAGIVEGVRLEREDNQLKLYPQARRVIE